MGRVIPELVYVECVNESIERLKDVEQNSNKTEFSNIIERLLSLPLVSEPDPGRGVTTGVSPVSFLFGSREGPVFVISYSSTLGLSSTVRLGNP